VPLTTTSYAILGLLELRDWTAYELTQQAHRSLDFVWPISESQLYAEPKRLEREGLITIRSRSAGPQRTRQLLKITAKGRKALRAWLATEPAAPRVQMEVLVRALFATAGTKQDLLNALEATRRSVQEAYEHGLSLVAAYQAGENPFPERIHANIIWMVFTHDLLVVTLRWIDFAHYEVSQWTDSTNGGNTSRIHELLEAMLASRRELVTRSPN
jgi:PadR family transcriptional regulator AphA